MSNALRSEQYRVVQIRVCGGAVAEGLTGMEDEGDLDTNFFLSLDEPLERLQVADERL